MKKTSALSKRKAKANLLKSPSFRKKLSEKVIRGIKKIIGKIIRKIRGQEIIVSNNEIFFFGRLPDFQSDRKFVRRMA